MTAVVGTDVAAMDDRAPDMPTPSPFGRVARGALTILSTQPLTWAAAVASAVWVPALLGERALGQYVVLWTIAGLIATGASLGVPDYLVRHVATQPRGSGSTDAAAALVLVVSLATAGGLLLMTALAIFGVVIPEGRLLPLALAGTVLGLAQSVLFAQMRGQERYARYAWLSAGTGAVGTAAGIGILTLGGDLEAYMASMLVALAVATTITALRSGIAVKVAALDPRRMLRVTLGGLPFLGWAIALRIYGEIDKLLLAVLATESVIGWYAAAYRIVMVPAFVANLVVTPLLPVLSRAAGDRAVFQDTLRRSIDLVLIASVPVTALTIGLAPSIPGALHWPIGFQNSVPLLTILAFHVPVAGVDVMLGTALIALHRQNSWLVVAVLAVVFNTSLNVVAIPILQSSTGNGAIAAAAVTVLTEILMLGGAILLLPRGMIGRASASTAVRLMVAGGGAAAVAAALQRVSLPTAVAASAIVYVVLAVALGGVSRGELRSLVRVSREWVRRTRAGSGLVAR